MLFGKVLRTLRQRNKLTQKQLADILGLSESAIGMYERGHREPDFETLECIADYFNVDMDYLTGRSNIEREQTCSPAQAPALVLTEAEEQLVEDYRDASGEIRDSAALMLHNSAELNRRNAGASALSAG